MAQADTNKVSKALLAAFAPLHRLAMGVAAGVVLGGLVFLMTASVLIRGPYQGWPNLALLGHYFLGYTVTWFGALIGLLWGFAVGFLMGWGFALLRNFAVWAWLLVVRSRAEMEQYDDFLDHV